MHHVAVSRVSGDVILPTCKSVGSYRLEDDGGGGLYAEFDGGESQLMEGMW